MPINCEQNPLFVENGTSRDATERQQLHAINGQQLDNRIAHTDENRESKATVLVMKNTD